MNSVTETEMTKVTQSDERLAAKLTKEYAQAVGKSVTSVLTLADILIRAKNGLSPDAHKTWLLQNRTDEGKASKGRSIAECPLFKQTEIQAQLPPSFTMMYQLSRIMRHDEFTPEVANGHFTTALTMLNTPGADGRFPTVEEITRHVNGLLGKRTAPTPKAETTVKSADDSVLPNRGPEVSQVESHGFTNGSRSLIDETTPEDFEDDNDIQILLEFAAAYQRAQVRNAILRVLHESGIKNVEVILRAKCVPVAKAA
jgi:hypothetical protein